MARLRILIVDLNNFARYPTIAVGYLTAVLRQAGEDVTVFSPLAYGVSGVTREPPDTLMRHLARKLNYAIDGSQNRFVKVAKDTLARQRIGWAHRQDHRIVEAFEALDPKSFDIVLVSTYLMYHSVCAEIGIRCQRMGIPLLIGGSYFSNDTVARSWLSLPGLTALIAGEVELELPALVRAVASRGALATFPGVRTPDGQGSARSPQRDLDRVAFPDYSDFPWRAYPNNLIPIITGRGCGWGACTFCSDVTSTAGRTFRSRSPGNVLAEIEHQSRKHETSLFVFTDLKLNSDLAMWNAIIENISKRATNPCWVCAVHVGNRDSNGLDASSLVKARNAGLTRITTGLETGSQRLLDLMKKGSDNETNSRFLRDASAAGLSVRVTMIHGYPGEEASDVRETVKYLQRHADFIDRISLNRFQIIVGPTFLRHYELDPQRYPSVRSVKLEPRQAIASHEYRPARHADYANATQQLLQIVHQINRKPLARTATEFNGVM
jgi:anaerobic magnesium-protoporphyrin IX monomethyl ester cyclase